MVNSILALLVQGHDVSYEPVRGVLKPLKDSPSNGKMKYCFNPAFRPYGTQPSPASPFTPQGSGKIIRQ